MTNNHISGIGIYNKNLFLELSKYLGPDISPVLKWTRFSKKRIVEAHVGRQVRLLSPVILNKKIIYHGTDHKLNTTSFGPKVVTIHDMQPFVNKWLNPEFAKKRRAVLDKTLRGPIDRIIAISEFTKSEILKSYPHLETKIDVIYHGCGLQLLESTENNRLANIISGRPFLLFVGNIEERKNLINQLMSFETLKKEYPELLFVIAGSAGFNSDKIYEYIQKSAYRESIILTGYLDENEKQYALQNTSCLMFASFYEGFGIPVIEALAYNSNVLISDTGALIEIAGAYCHSANPLSIDDIAMKTKQIINHGNKQKIDSNLWMEKWSWKNTAIKTLDVYKKLYM